MKFKHISPFLLLLVTFGSSAQAAKDDHAIECYARLKKVPCNPHEESYVKVRVEPTGQFRYEKFIPGQCYAEEQRIVSIGRVAIERREMTGVAQFMELVGNMPSEVVEYKELRYLLLGKAPAEHQLIEVFVSPLGEGSGSRSRHIPVTCRDVD